MNVEQEEEKSGPTSPLLNISEQEQRLHEKLPALWRPCSSVY